MSIRCKFYCSEVAQTKWGHGEGALDAERVKLSAVYDSTDANKAWSKATPSGQLEVTITNPEAMGQFKPGKAYFLDVTPVTPAD